MGLFKNRASSGKQVFPGFPDSIHEEDDQQYRMFKGDDIYLYISALSRDKTSATIIGETDAKYQTTLSGCSCPDFKKRKKPCAHMYKLAFYTKRMDPKKFYTRPHQFKMLNINPADYITGDINKGHRMSFNKYQITAEFAGSGRLRKEVVYGKNASDAVSHLPSEYKLPPESVELIPFEPPTHKQIADAVSCGITIPPGICKEDMSCIWDEYIAKSEGEHYIQPDPSLIKFALKQRILFSYYSSEPRLINYIYNKSNGLSRCAFLMASYNKSNHMVWDFDQWDRWMTAAAQCTSIATFEKACGNLKVFYGFDYKSKNYAPPSKNSIIVKTISEYT